MIKNDIPLKTEDPEIIAQEVDQACDIPDFYVKVKGNLEQVITKLDAAEAERKADIGDKSVAKSTHIANIDSKVNAWTSNITDFCGQKLDEMEALEAKIADM